MRELERRRVAGARVAQDGGNSGSGGDGRKSVLRGERLGVTFTVGGVKSCEGGRKGGRDVRRASGGL